MRVGVMRTSQRVSHTALSRVECKFIARLRIWAGGGSQKVWSMFTAALIHGYRDALNCHRMSDSGCLIWALHDSQMGGVLKWGSYKQPIHLSRKLYIENHLTLTHTIFVARASISHFAFRRNYPEYIYIYIIHIIYIARMRMRQAPTQDR